MTRAQIFYFLFDWTHSIKYPPTIFTVHKTLNIDEKWLVKYFCRSHPKTRGVHIKFTVRIILEAEGNFKSTREWWEWKMTFFSSQKQKQWNHIANKFQFHILNLKKFYPVCRQGCRRMNQKVMNGIWNWYWMLLVFNNQYQRILSGRLEQLMSWFSTQKVRWYKNRYSTWPSFWMSALAITDIFGRLKKFWSWLLLELLLLLQQKFNARVEQNNVFCLRALDIF